MAKARTPQRIRCGAVAMGEEYRFLSSGSLILEGGRLEADLPTGQGMMLRSVGLIVASSKEEPGF